MGIDKRVWDGAAKWAWRMIRLAANHGFSASVEGHAVRIEVPCVYRGGDVATVALVCTSERDVYVALGY